MGTETTPSDPAKNFFHLTCRFRRATFPSRGRLSFWFEMREEKGPVDLFQRRTGRQALEPWEGEAFLLPGLITQCVRPGLDKLLFEKDSGIIPAKGGESDGGRREPEKTE